MPKVDRDRLFSVPREAAATHAHQALFPIQEFPPHEQVAGIAILFAAITHRLQLDPQEMHQMGMKMLRPEPFHRGTNVQLEALRDYAGLRLAGEKVTTG